MSARKSGKPQATPNLSTVTELRSYAERVVRKEDQRKQLAGDIKDILNEAASRGFDKKALKIVISRWREGEAEREARVETESLADLYLASLGMLDGTPLGDAARRRFDPIADPDDRDDDQDHDDDDDRRDGAPAGGDGAVDVPPSLPPSGAMSEETIATARDEGSAAAEAGEKIFANPYVAGDPRRAAWDEGWCARTGSDGMEIPDAWRRKKKPKPAGDDASDGAPS